ncbi:MAG: NAD(P)/FAD-dependent oxidoreductase [Clostridiales bacterium]|nr:NAD(P)/FAD-dependent oxidoreductase [Clostridiales bacterium]
MKVVVIGGGAAGQLAAAEAASNGNETVLLEQNEKLGKKLYITGKGRCNLTNTADRDEFIRNVTRNPRFLYSALNTFDHTDICALIEKNGVPVKTERGGRAFPASDKSSDVIKALKRNLDRAGVEVRLNTKATGILISDGRVDGVRTNAGIEPADAVIIATGGVSYPQTGSTGDGYRFASEAGHTVVAPKPSLVGLCTKETWPYELTGLTLKNVGMTAKRNGKRIFKELGELLLTHFGISGPMVLSLSSVIADSYENVEISIDLKPALDEQTLDARLLRDLEENRLKTVKGAFHALLPSKLLNAVMAEAGINGEGNVSDFTKSDRRKLLSALKEMRLTVSGTRSFDEAIVTRGGVSVSEVNSSTMESKLVKGLYFAGEVLDVDAMTGGFNLQIAWSTGVLAGRSIGQ